MSDLATVVPFEGPVSLGIRVAMMNLDLGEGRLETTDDRLSLEGSIAFNLFGNQGDGEIAILATKNGGGEWDFSMRMDGTMGGKPLKVNLDSSGPCTTEKRPEDPTLKFALQEGNVKLYRKKERVFLDLTEVVSKLPGPLVLKALEG